jgi:N-acetylmuramoyl-L-alanine amidase
MPTQHEVQQGDCLFSIADKFGFTWKKLWNHPDNAELKRLRQDPAVLYPGDIVKIPDKEVHQKSRPTDARHRFIKSSAKTHIKVRLLLDDRPRAGLAYEFQVGDRTVSGTTDGEGFLQEDIPAWAETGVLTVGEGESRSVYQLRFGTLDPMDTEEGVQKRLLLLGYDAEEDLVGAVREFRTREGLQAGDTVDDDLRAKLKEKFGQ